jgi:hypothetical protein
LGVTVPFSISAAEPLRSLYPGSRYDIDKVPTDL